MMGKFGWRAATGVAGVLAWIALTAVQLPFPARGALGIIAAACAWYNFRIYRKHRETQEKERIIRLINHHRHDWMNQLQILFGYTRLKKHDILLDYMDKIRTSAQYDSLLSKLGNPSLIVYLLERRMTGGDCQVEVELESEVDLRRLAMEEEQVYRLVSGVMDRIIGHASPLQGECGVISLGFDEAEDGLVVDYVYQGNADWDGLKIDVGAFLQKWEAKLKHKEEEYGEGRAVIALTLPF